MNGTLKIATRANEDLVRAFTGNQTLSVDFPDAFFGCQVPDSFRCNGTAQESKLWRVYHEYQTSICANYVEDFGDVYLMLNRTIPYYCDDKNPRNEFGRAHGGENEWAYINNQAGKADLSVTLCFTDISGGYRNVSVTSQSNMTEPALRWDYRTNDYDTNAIRQQLGATIDASPRRHFTIERPEAIKPIPGLGVEMVPDTIMGVSTSIFPMDGEYCILLMCQFCGTSWSPKDEKTLEVHRTQIAIFQDAFRTTKNIALAFQAFLTINYGISSAPSLLEANVPQAASIRSFAVVSRPTQWTGF
jgi:hypothetical protein